MTPRTASATSLASTTTSTTTASQEEERSVTSIRLGFIGTGVIASAIVTGLATTSTEPVQIESIGVSKRSQAKSQALLKAFPELVTVYDKDNQAVVDNADIVFVTVLPEQAKAVLQELTFDADRHWLVSLVSTSQLPDLAADSGLPLSRIYKMICLPAVATQDGVCLVTPPITAANPVLRTLLESLGGVVEAATEREMSIMMVPSALMGGFYGILKNNRDWLIGQGVAPDKADLLIRRQYHAIVVDANNRKSDDDATGVSLEDLIAEQTPGGLNEQGLANLSKLGLFDAYDKVQNAMVDRILGKSDGSLREEDL